MDEGDKIIDQAKLSQKLELEKQQSKEKKDLKQEVERKKKLDIYKMPKYIPVPAIALKGQQYQSQGNYAMANKCFLKAAKQGDGGSLYNLGVNYDAGHGVTQDSAKAADFYQACLSISDDPLAMCNLGTQYCYGTGRSQSFYMARFWWQKGSALLEENCVASLRDLNVFEKRDKDYVQVFDEDIISCTFCRLPEIELGAKLKKCVCRTGAAYCNSETCQKLHWKWGGHKKIHHAAMESRTTEQDQQKE